MEMDQTPHKTWTDVEIGLMHACILFVTLIDELVKQLCHRQWIACENGRKG
jgi:hypothetical protein